MVTFIKDVPRKRRVRYDWEKITAELRENPNKWAVLEDTGDEPSTVASAQATSRKIRNGYISGIKEGEFEATTRGNTVYARYIGGK